MRKHSTVQLVVEGFGEDPALVTELMGFAPTSVSRCGFSSLSTHSAWLFEPSQSVSEDVQSQLSALLCLLEPHAEEVTRVAGRFHAYIGITVDDRDWVWPYDPTGYRSGEFVLSPLVTAAASRMGIGFKVHFFCGLSEGSVHVKGSCRVGPTIDNL